MEDNYRVKQTLGSQRLAHFNSIYDSAGQSDDLWMNCDKKLNHANHTTLGPLIYSSRLSKKSKSFTKLTLTRWYFLYEGYLIYGTSSNSARAKKYIKLEGLKFQVCLEKNSLNFSRSDKSFQLFTNNIQILNEWKYHLSRFCVMQDFDKNYTTSDLIGSGADGQVFLAKNLDRNKYAVKIFDKARISSRFQNYKPLVDEIRILQSSKHENIVKFYEVYETATHVHLVLEYLAAGNLEDHLEQKKEYEEKDALLLLRNILKAVIFLNSKGILHRDLKPGNIMLSSLDNDTDIKLIDFGQSAWVESQVGECGTLGYMAPELLRKGSSPPPTNKVDVFSAGAIFYELLAGRKVFAGYSYGELARLNKTCSVDYRVFDQRKISPEAMDLMKKMLEWDPDVRISPTEALEHPAFRKGGFKTLMSLKSTEMSEVASSCNL